MSESTDIILSTNWRNKSTRKLEATRAANDFDTETLADLVRDRWEADENSTSTNSVVMYLRALDLWLEYLRPDPDLSPTVQIKHADDDTVRDWLTWLRDKKKLQVSSRKLYLAGLRYFYRSLVWAGVVASNPAELVKSPRDKRDPMTLREKVPDEDLRALFKYLYSVVQAPVRARTQEDPRSKRVISTKKDRTEQLTGYRDLLMLCLGYYGGLRVSSIVALRVQDVVLEKSESYLDIKQAKGMREFRVPITQDLEQALTLWEPVRSGIARPEESRLLVNVTHSSPKYRGRGLSEKSARLKLQRLYERAGIAHRYRGWQAFRHACGSRLAATGDIQLAQKWLGHQSIQTTAASYGERDLKSLSAGKDALRLE